MTIQVNGLFLGTLKPDATVAGCIDIFENVWPEPEKTIDIVEKESRAEGSNIYWERASTIGQGVHQNIRTNSHMGVSHLANIADNGILQNIHNQFYTLLLSTTVDYANRYKIDGNMKYSIQHKQENRNQNIRGKTTKSEIIMFEPNCSLDSLG